MIQHALLSTLTRILVFVFGGCGLKGRLNDLWSFDPVLEEWSCLHPGDGSGAPVARGGSSLVASADGSRLALLFGFSGQSKLLLLL